MILEAHVRDGRDILVSDDRRAFVGHDGANRCKLESALATRIMTVDEFCEFASTLRILGGIEPAAQ